MDAITTDTESEPNRESLRALIGNLPAAPSTRAECQNLWQGLAEQRLAIVASFLHEGQAQLVFSEARSLGAPGAATPKSWQLFESYLLGTDRKALCFDLNLCTSTLAQALKQTLASIGLNCSPGRVPLALALLAHAAAGSSSRQLRLARVEFAGRCYLVLSANLHSKAWDQLSSAERAVLELRAIGKSHSDIAQERKTSRRTVANQVAAASHRLGVSGRLDLLRVMACAQ